MYIGTSFGKCLKDILDGQVKEDEVLVIVSNTMCPTLDKLIGVVDEYYYNYSHRHGYDLTAHPIEVARATAQKLFEGGKLHQPRVHMQNLWGNAHALQDTWYEIVPTPTSHHPSVVDAYEKYRMVATLAL